MSTPDANDSLPLGRVSPHPADSDGGRGKELQGANYDQGWTAPARQALAVTPSDSVDLVGGPFRGLWVGGAGNVSVILAGDSAPVTLVGVQAGSLIPVQVKRVRTTLTTATDLVALN